MRFTRYRRSGVLRWQLVIGRLTITRGRTEWHEALFFTFDKKGAPRG